MIEILSPGLLTTVQDLGRTGYAALGYPECGACDKRLYAVANILTGNSGMSAALECTVFGPTLRFSAPAVAAVTGSAHPTVNGLPVRTCFPLLMRAGDVLDVGPIDRMRAYVAVRGGIDVPEVLGSRSTDTKCRIGGLEGRVLKAGDVLPVPEDSVNDYPALRRCAARIRLPRFAAPEAVTPIHVIPGPQADAFTGQGISVFFSGIYTVTKDASRMGVKLDGPAVQSVRGTDILSDGILEGSIQISSDGMPIVMLADHQTTGGYAKIATVIPTDLPLMAQLRPGDRLCFQSVTVEEGLSRYRAEAEQMKQLMEEMQHDASGSEFGSGGELRRVQHRHGRRCDPVRHICQRRLRISRR